MATAGEKTEEKKNLPVQGAHGDGLQCVAFVFSAEAGFLEFIILWPDTGAFHPVDGNVAILFNELREFLRGSRRPRGQYAEVQQGALQDWKERYYMGMGVPAAEAKMEAQHVEDGVVFAVIQEEEELLVEGVEVPFRPARRDLLDLALLQPFQLDRAVGDSKGDREGVAMRAADADEGFYGAVMLDSVQWFELFVGHGLMVCRVE